MSPVSSGVDISVWGQTSLRKDLENRIEVASLGCDKPDESIRHRYDSEARVPSGQWVRATSAELDNLIFRNSTTNPHQTIAIVSLPKEMREAFNPLKSLSRRYGRLAPLVSWASSKAGGDAIECATQILKKYGPVERVLGINGRPAGLVTSTHRGAPSFQFVGLHCDSHDGRPFPEPALDPLRFCVNLGEEPRHFLFLNRSVSALRAKIDHQLKSVYEVVQAHLISERAGPVFRIRIDPNEAYIAPTFNLIHDASTEGRKTPDVTFSALGQFYFERFDGFSNE